MLRSGVSIDNKLVALPFPFAPVRSAHRGGEQRVGAVGSGGVGDVLEASTRGVPKRWRLRAAVIFGRRCHSMPRCSMLRGFLVLQAGVPLRRIFSFSAAHLVGLTPSGFVPGGEVNGRCFEALQQRWWRRARLLFRFLCEGLFAYVEDYVVLSVVCRVLSVNSFPPI